MDHYFDNIYKAWVTYDKQNEEELYAVMQSFEYCYRCGDIGHLANIAVKCGIAPDHKTAISALHGAS